MRFENEGQSGDIQDRRGVRTAAGVGGGLSIGGILLVTVFSLLTGRNPLEVLSQVSAPETGGGPQTGAASAGPRNASEAEAEQLVRRATTDIQNFWTSALPRMANGTAYRRTQLVLFADATRSGCGTAEGQSGPFYCPNDQLVYIDLGFYGELAQRFGAPGDFAQAYVLAHEFGHHIQHLLGTDERMRALQQQDRSQRNPLSVALELQADCYAGVWGASARQRNLLDPNDIEEGMAAAASVGDDRIQREARGRVTPETFTHGSSAQRTAWFRAGLQSGSIASCNTFGNAM